MRQERGDVRNHAVLASRRRFGHGVTLARPNLATRATADIAPVVAFLMSDESSWFRGANLTPDGGLSSHMTLKEVGLA